MFRTTIRAVSPSLSVVRYTRVPGMAYLQMLDTRLSMTRLSSLLSAATTGCPSGDWVTSVRWQSASRS